MTTPAVSKIFSAFFIGLGLLLAASVLGAMLWSLLGGRAYMDARAECALFNQRDYVTDTCFVDWWDKSVNVTFNASAEAIEAYCAKTNDLFSYEMAEVWVLKISTPYAAGGPVARCRYRTKYIVEE